MLALEIAEGAVDLEAENWADHAAGHVAQEVLNLLVDSGALFTLVLTLPSFSRGEGGGFS